MKTKSDNENIKKLIESGSNIVGSATGGLLGFFTGGPIGAVIGGASSPIIAKTLAKIGNDIKERVLSNREEIRVGATVSYSVFKIQENLKKGKVLRDDDFFNDRPNSRSDADEIFEGLLLSSKKEYQEKKLIYTGNLMGNIPFDKNIDKSFANQLIKLSESISYNQLCLLKVFYLSGNQKTLKLRQTNYREETNLDRKLVTLLYDIMELENLNLIVNSKHHVFGLTDIIPSEFSVQGNGNALGRLMELNSIPDEDIKEVIKLLSE